MNHVVLCLEQPPLYGNGLRCYRNLSEGQRAKLGLRIGRRFKTLGGVEIVQIDKVWEIIGNLGLTQSYKLWRSSDRVSERDFPTDSPAQTFYLYVTFKRSYSDDTPPGPATLTAEELGELAQGIGEDLDILRSLDKNQILNVLNRIYESRYLHGYQIWSDQEIVNIDLDALMTGPDEHLLPINFEDFLQFDGLEMESGHQNTLMTPNNAIHPGNPPEVAENGMVTSPVSTSTETDVDSAYPTPSSDGLDSPRPRGKPTRTNSPRTPNHGRANSRNIQSQRKGTGAGIKLNPIAKTLLKGNNPKLKDIDITKILAVDACILPPDFQTLRSLSDQWHNNESQGQHALGLPKDWIGIHAAWNYLKELEAETLEPVAENVAYLLFHFNYKELCKFAEHYCGRPLREKERADSCVYDCIIEAAYLDDWTRNLEGHELRKKIGNHIRKAKWCWEVVANLGAGVLLKGGWVAKCYNESLSNARANALVTYILNTRPGTARLFRSLEPTMKTLMSGRLPDLIKTVRAGGTGLQDQLYTLSVEDEKALVSQSPENRWALIDVAQIAEERVSDFLYSPELCSFANIYTC